MPFQKFYIKLTELVTYRGYQPCMLKNTLWLIRFLRDMEFPVVAKFKEQSLLAISSVLSDFSVIFSSLRSYLCRISREADALLSTWYFRISEAMSSENVGWQGVHGLVNSICKWWREILLEDPKHRCLYITTFSHEVQNDFSAAVHIWWSEKMLSGAICEAYSTGLA